MRGTKNPIEKWIDKEGHVRFVYWRGEMEINYRNVGERMIRTASADSFEKWCKGAEKIYG